MAIYELRTYTVTVGKMNDVVALYQAEGWPALSKHPKKLCGYFTGDIGALNQLVHLWKFDDDADRRAFHARKADDHVFGEVLADFEEVALVHDLQDQFLHVVGLVGIVGD